MGDPSTRPTHETPPSPDGNTTTTRSVEVLFGPFVMTASFLYQASP